MKRVLIIGPNFHYFNASIARAFQSLGWETLVDAYDTPVHPYTAINKLCYKFGDKSHQKQLSRERYDAHIRTIVDMWSPTLVFVLNGDNILPKTMQYIAQRVKTAIWTFDSVRRYPILIENLPYVAAVFCYEQEDIPYLKQKLNIDAHFLPQAYDPQLYYPIMDATKKYDLSFAGDVWQSKKRQAILQAIVDRFPNKKIIVWGVYKPWYKGIWRWLTRERRDIYKNCNTTAEVLNRTYNESRVVLNIHNEQQKSGANPKVYEIAASGALQLCDCNPYIEEVFGDSPKIKLYSNKEELLTLLEIIFENPSTHAEAMDMSQHTFEKRIEEVLYLL